MTSLFGGGAPVNEGKTPVTIAQLKEALSAYPDDTPVYIEDADTDWLLALDLNEEPLRTESENGRAVLILRAGYY